MRTLARAAKLIASAALCSWVISVKVDNGSRSGDVT